MTTPLQALAARLDALQPRSLLYLGTQPASAFTGADDKTDGRMKVTARNDVRSVADLAGEGRYDCALVADFLEHLPKADGVGVLGRLRNLHAPQLLVFIDHANSLAPWTLDDFIALGFRHDSDLRGEPGEGQRNLSLYSYDIATYNHEREWNNPRFWANPEMWGKYFW
ncbi:MAG: DUF6231 family protein [Gammaproteobacteria bacterium]